MKPVRRTATMVGVLFLLGYLGVFLGSALYAPTLDAPDYLARIFPERARVIRGMLIELINDAAVVGIAVLLFPILRRHGEGIALGYVGFRVVEAAILVVGKTSVLSLVTLSQEYIAAGAAEASSYRAAGAFALAAREWTGKISSAFFILGAVILYSMLYKSKLVPRFISVWGLVAAASLATANLLGVPDLTQGFQPAMILYSPIVVSELLLAIWLIVKGFNPSAIATESARQM
jgi:hypothetical protein